ncbi:glycosyl transferase-like protein [Dinothrombium tinctorium]|uniref:UDP-glucuronosyltransferase n=1 Tax=Dinothrombium tinctorium TaxID=1965070 RepID=A0A3S3SFN7_9ACAR|nr:glycosyl transferase-like protein [Dinothrombium tinctorium]RWS17299.1 glycosyl transferase-like protein [Dinothrombium tinctorium]RWS17305.1 glycosyl transferase-like protein [Dinothrombium tinctorium]
MYQIWNENMKTIWRKMNEALEANALPALRKYRLRHVSTNLNVYIYPKPLMEDYLRLCPLSDEWIGLDHSIRECSQKFSLPSKFDLSESKLIYLSMGTLGSNNFELMSRLITILAKCKHRIIIVTGKYHSLYKLADNIWGESFLPQLEILPLVDLVITHGGNNTFVETIYFGKPMIVLPLFNDQFDNAQRAVETKIGIRLDPFTVEEQAFLDAIDNLLNDFEAKQRVELISKQMKESNSMESVVNRIEKIAKHPKIPTVF